MTELSDKPYDVYDDSKIWIRCIGVDNKQHVCEPHSDTCFCGVTVKRKKLLKFDYKLLSCYPCTY